MDASHLSVVLVDPSAEGEIGAGGVFAFMFSDVSLNAESEPMLGR